MMETYGLSRQSAADALRYFGLAGTAFILQKIEQEGLSYAYLDNVVLPVKKMIAEQGLSIADISDLFQEHSASMFQEGFPLAYAVAMRGFGRMRTDNIRPVCCSPGRELPYEGFDVVAHKQVGNVLGECHNDSYASVGDDDEANYSVTKMDKE